MDGFTINKKFYCKELGIPRVGNAAAQSYFFYLGVCWSDLSEKDRKACGYVIKYIHKLPFGVPQGVSAINLSAFESIVADVYREMKQDESLLMAYKGGHYESDLLANLDIRAVNLENFGCPKAEIIVNHLIWLETYGTQRLRTLSKGRS